MNEHQQKEYDKININLDQAIKDKALKLADKNSAITIHNPDRFFGAKKGIFSTKYDQKEDTYYFILRPDFIQEPKLDYLKKVVNNQVQDDINFIVMVHKGYINAKYVLGKIIDNFEV